MMVHMTNLFPVYFFGIGYTMIDEDKVLEIRSISSEMIEKGKEAKRSYNPTILKADLRELSSSSLDEEFLQKVSQEIIYQEWILSKEDVQPFLDNGKLVDIPLCQIISFPLRPSIQPST